MKFVGKEILEKITKSAKRLFKSSAAIIMIVVMSCTCVNDSYGSNYRINRAPSINLSFPPTPSEMAACFGSTWEVDDASSNSYFSPAIDVKHTQCLFCGCWAETNTLSAFGECAFYPVEFFLRACARLTLPGTYGAPLWQDPPNTPSLPNMSAAMANQLPLVCGFEDPMSPFDGNDWAAYSMPFQQHSPPNSGGTGSNTAQVAKTLLVVGVVAMFFAPEGVGELLLAAGAIALLIANSPVNQTVIANHGCVQIPMAPYPPPYNYSIPNIPMEGSVVNICNSVYNSNFTSAGLSVSPGLSSTSLTTVTPAASPPNPYTAMVVPYSTIFNTCELSGSYAQDSSTPAFSTFENPIGRVAFKNPLVLCNPDSPTTGNPTCVNFTNANSVSNIFSFNNLGLISECSGSGSDPCFSFSSGSITPLPGAGNGPFRADYQCPGTTNNIPWALVTNPITGSLYNSTCTNLTLTGIEYSKFVDLSASFAAGNANATPSNMVPITDIMFNQKYVYAQSPDANSPSQICLYAQNSSSTPPTWAGQAYNCNSNPCPALPTDPDAGTRLQSLLGCISRPQMPLPVVAACGTSVNVNYNGGAATLNQSCSTTRFAPGIAFGLGKPFQQASLQYSPGSKAAMPSYYLHGYNFTMNLTDSYYSSLDVYGNKFGNYNYAADGSGGVVDTSYNTQAGTKNQNAILSQLNGAYVDTSGQLRDSSGNPIASIQDANNVTIYYQNGLEYIYGSYVRGATTICLEGYQTTGQVLSNLVNLNIQTPLSPAVAPPGYGAINSTATQVTSKVTTDRVIPAYNASETYPLATNYVAPLVTPNGSGGFNYTGGSINGQIPAGQATRATTSLEDGLCLTMQCQNSQATYPNATSSNSSGTTAAGLTLTLTCNSGFIGSVTATCQYPGWSYSGSCTPSM